VPLDSTGRSVRARQGGRLAQVSVKRKAWPAETRPALSATAHRRAHRRGLTAVPRCRQPLTTLSAFPAANYSNPARNRNSGRGRWPSRRGVKADPHPQPTGKACQINDERSLLTVAWRREYPTEGGLLWGSGSSCFGASYLPAPSKQLRPRRPPCLRIQHKGLKPLACPFRPGFHLPAKGFCLQPGRWLQPRGFSPLPHRRGEWSLFSADRSAPRPVPLTTRSSIEVARRGVCLLSLLAGPGLGFLDDFLGQPSG